MLGYCYDYSCGSYHLASATARPPWLLALRSEPAATPWAAQQPNALYYYFYYYYYCYHTDLSYVYTVYICMTLRLYGYVLYGDLTTILPTILSENDLSFKKTT